MVKLAKKFHFGSFDYLLIQKEEIPIYLEKHDRILVLTLDDIHKTLKSNELIYLGYQYLKRKKDEEIFLRDFLLEVKREKLYSHPELTINDLFFYVGVLSENS